MSGRVRGKREDEKHKAYHPECFECRPNSGSRANHNDCTGKCGEEGCSGPCPCSCSLPLDRQERMRLRRMLKALAVDDEI